MEWALVVVTVTIGSAWAWVIEIPSAAPFTIVVAVLTPSVSRSWAGLSISSNPDNTTVFPVCAPDPVGTVIVSESSPAVIVTGSVAKVRGNPVPPRITSNLTLSPYFRHWMLSSTCGTMAFESGKKYLTSFAHKAYRLSELWSLLIPQPQSAGWELRSPEPFFAANLKQSSPKAGSFAGNSWIVPVNTVLTNGIDCCPSTFKLSDKGLAVVAVIPIDPLSNVTLVASVGLFLTNSPLPVANPTVLSAIEYVTNSLLPALIEPVVKSHML